MSDLKYWQGLGDLHNTPEYQENVGREFPEGTQVDLVEESSKGEPTGRRDFLKLMGFSVSAVAVATSCKIPVKKAIPYAFDGRDVIPEVVPGIADYFASTFYEGHTVESILVKVREGRPIKIESNQDSPLAGNGTSARAQASVLDLYDVTRLSGPKKGNDFITWGQADKEIADKLAQLAANGEKIVLISNSLASPITNKVIDKFKTKYATAEHYVYDPVSYSAIRKANKTTLGAEVIPSYSFDKAQVIVGFNCDFLGTWLLPVTNASQYSKNRVPTKKNPTMSRHYQFQSNVTITGSSADYKYTMRPSEEKAALIDLLNAVSGSSLAGGGYENKDAIKKVAVDLKNAQGKSLIVSGTNNVDIQLLVNAINASLNNYGETINTGATINIAEGDDTKFSTLVSEISNGVGAVILLNCNPVYNTPFGNQIKEVIGKASLSVALNYRLDESSELAQYNCPISHALESWNAIEPIKGHISFVQPSIRPIFDTRQLQDSLLTWSGESATFHDFIQSELNLGFAGWNTNLAKGFLINEVSGGASASLAATISAINTSKVTSSGIEVQLYSSISIGEGNQSNNPFLQELPDPITKATWDNCLQISYDMAQKEGIADYSNYKKVTTADVTVNGTTVTLPVIVSFGQAKDTVSIALGYGRTKGGRAADGVGKDVYPFVTAKDGVFTYWASDAKISFNKSAKYKISTTQVYSTLMEDNALPGKTAKYRSGIIKEANLAEYQMHENAGNEDREKILHHMKTLYPEHEYNGHHWGMSIDMNSCIGCNACVVSCNVENNVPVVGPEEVWNNRDMHWIRIDRYYSGDKNNPDVSFQPMLCQHCDNAPCENVCPVNATNHSSEGLNQMIYNRCIGTRYCANNCPYKVRRFNWLDYQGADYFGKYNDGKKGFGRDGGVEYMYEDLTRMVLNPDVTVRSRGVIEKCSFCAQKIQESKLTAKKEKRKLKDGDIKTACQSACPTNAIVFGDMNDKDSEVHNLFFKNARNYHLLEEQHFLPSVGYQVKIRNKDEKSAKDFS
jgi:molybdopterin-containing oxidoreductase family iron-sulfur binding subunit